MDSERALLVENVGTKEAEEGAGEAVWLLKEIGVLVVVEEEKAEAMEEEDADSWLRGEGPWEIAMFPEEMVAVCLGETERTMTRGLEGILLSGTVAKPMTSQRNKGNNFIHMIRFT